MMSKNRTEDSARTGLRLAFALILLASCYTRQPYYAPETDAEEPTATAEDSGRSDSDTSAECVEPDDTDAVFGPIQIEISDAISTVATVSWSPTTPGSGWVQLPEGQQAPATTDASGRAQAVLMGLTADTTVPVQIVHDDGVQVWCSATLEVTTGSLPTGLPMLTISHRDRAQEAGGYLLMPIRGDLLGWRLILNRDGEVVWYYPADAIRMWLSRDGQSILSLDNTYQHDDPNQPGLFERISLDGRSTASVRVPGAHTDVVEVGGGVYATLGWDVRPNGDGRDILGETIQEFSIDGEPVVIWSLFDDLDPKVEEIRWEKQNGIWAHLNHLHYAPEEDAYYVTARYLMSVMRIDRSTGRMTWHMGPGGDIGFTGEEAKTMMFNPHSAIPTEDGVLLFDTASEFSGGCSALSEFAIDLEDKLATNTWMYVTEDCLTSHYLGNALELDNGNRMMILTVNAQIDEVNSDGELVWRLEAPNGSLIKYTTWEQTLYPD